MRWTLAVVVVLLLSGCSGLFAPDPTASPVAPTATPAATPAADVACTTKNSTISDSDPSATGPAENIVVLADIARFDAKGQNVEQESQSVDATGVVDVTPSNAFDSLVGSQNDWRVAVLDAIHSLGTVPRNLGIVSGTITAKYNSPFAVPDARNAIWIRGYVARSHIVPFAVNCPDGFRSLGTVTTFDPNNATDLQLECDGRKHPSDSAAKAALRAVCDDSSIDHSP